MDEVIEEGREEVVSKSASAPSTHGISALLFFITLSGLFATISASFLQPFYPVYAMKTYDADEGQIGLIFGLYPLGGVVASVLVTEFCGTKYGKTLLSKLFIWYMGLITLVASTISFGYGWTIQLQMVSYFFQGLASAMINVSGMMILTASSTNVTKDVGTLEVRIAG